ADLGRQAEERERLQADLLQQAKERETLQGGLSEQARESERLRAELSQQVEERERLQAELLQQAQERGSLQEELSQRAREYEQLRAELSQQGLWAATAPLASAVVASGSFVATGQNKQVQHLEGGIIREILVKEGDVVEANQSLIRLDDTPVKSKLRRLVLQRYRLI